MIPVDNIERYFIMKGLTSNFCDIEKYVNKIGVIDMNFINKKYAQFTDLGCYIADNIEIIHSNEILSDYFYNIILQLNEKAELNEIITKNNFLQILLETINKHLFYIESEFFIENKV